MNEITTHGNFLSKYLYFVLNQIGLYSIERHSSCRLFLTQVDTPVILHASGRYALVILTAEFVGN